MDPLIKRLMLSSKNQWLTSKAHGLARSRDQWLTINLQNDPTSIRVIALRSGLTLTSFGTSRSQIQILPHSDQLHPAVALISRNHLRQKPQQSSALDHFYHQLVALAALVVSLIVSWSIRAYADQRHTRTTLRTKRSSINCVQGNWHDRSHSRLPTQATGGEHRGLPATSEPDLSSTFFLLVVPVILHPSSRHMRKQKMTGSSLPRIECGFASQPSPNRVDCRWYQKLPGRAVVGLLPAPERCKWHGLRIVRPGRSI